MLLYYHSLRCTIQAPSGLPRSLEAALHRYGSSTYKALAVTVLDQNGKPTVNLAYGKDCTHNRLIDLLPNSLTCA